MNVRAQDLVGHTLGYCVTWHARKIVVRRTRVLTLKLIIPRVLELRVSHQPPQFSRRKPRHADTRS